MKISREEMHRSNSVKFDVGVHETDATRQIEEAHVNDS